MAEFENVVWSTYKYISFAFVYYFISFYCKKNEPKIELCGIPFMVGNHFDISSST